MLEFLEITMITIFDFGLEYTQIPLVVQHLAQFAILMDPFSIWAFLWSHLGLPMGLSSPRVLLALVWPSSGPSHGPSSLL